MKRRKKDDFLLKVCGVQGPGENSQVSTEETKHANDQESTRLKERVPTSGRCRRLAAGHPGRWTRTGMQTSDVRNNQDCHAGEFNPERTNDLGPKCVDGKQRQMSRSWELG